MSKNLDIFEFHLQKLDKLFLSSEKQANPGIWLFVNDLRTPLFMLEALCRVYSDIYQSKKFKKFKEQFKEVENALGEIDYYAEFSRELDINNQIPARIIKYLNKCKEQKIVDLNEILISENWLNGDTINDFRKFLKKNDWFNDKKELEEIQKYYTIEKTKIQDFSKELNFTFTDIEEHVHELRRKLRWLSIYPQAFQGLFQYSEQEKNTAAKFKKYHSEEILNSRFNVLPQTYKFDKVVVLNKNNFLSLSWIINELGSIKDDGLKIEILKEAIQNTQLLKDIDAYNQAYSYLGSNYPTMIELLKKSEEVCRVFMKDNILDSILENQ